MSMNSDILAALSTVNLPKEACGYTGTSTSYIVLSPIMQWNDEVADNVNLTETEQMDVDLYYVGNYLSLKDTIKNLLESAGFFIAGMNYIERIKLPDGTYQHHYVFTVDQKRIL